MAYRYMDGKLEVKNEEGKVLFLDPVPPPPYGGYKQLIELCIVLSFSV